MKKILPLLVIAGVAYFVWKEMSKSTKSTKNTLPLYKGPFETGTVTPGLTTTPPSGFKEKYFASRPVGAYYTGKIRKSPAPRVPGYDGKDKFDAEVYLQNRKYDWVEVVPI